MKTITKNEVNILIISHYFWPENFKINELADYLSNKNKVTVLTGFPSYPKKELFKNFKNYNSKKIKNIEIIRIPVLPRGNTRFSIFLNYLSYLFSLSTLGIIKLFNRRFDSILVFGTSPPTVMIPAILISKIKKIKIIFWVLDLWPETLISMNVVKNKYLIKLLRIYISYIYNFSHLIFAQSKSFISQVGKYCNNKEKIIYFPTWADNNDGNKKNIKKFNFKKNFFYITFTGNIGEAQDFENILKCASIIKSNKKIKWLIVGDGSKYVWLKNQIKKRKLDLNFILTGNLIKDQIPYILKNSDCLLVTLKKGKIDKYTVPGKLSNYMMSKKPILGMIDGETYDIIRISKCGLICKSGEYKKLSSNIKKILTFSQSKKLTLGKNGYKFAKKNFDRIKQLKKAEFFLKKNI